MAEDHVFIDSLGRAVRGREAIRQGWRSATTAWSWRVYADNKPVYDVLAKSK